MSTPVIVLGARGRMGQTIARLATESPDHSLAALVERPGCDAGLEAAGCPVGTDLDAVLPQRPGAVVIDFTAPEASVAAAETCARHGNPIVIGTTGLTPQQRDALAASAENTRVFFAPNMSVGVNVLLQVLPKLVQLLGEAYDLEMVELHHKHKKDAPSGTALKLADCLAEARGWDLEKVGRYCREGIIGAREHEEIGVQTIRGGDVVGVHTVYCLGPGERIEVTHQAHSRETFASGSLRAAAWLSGQKPGRLYGMEDMLSGD